MLQTDNCHMVMASSHVVPGKKYIDLMRLRSPDILLNNVSHVCCQHAIAVADKENNLLTCPCYLFNKPPHLRADTVYRRILNTFGEAAGGDNEDDNDAALLYEVGLIPELKNWGLEAGRLAVPAAGQRFASRLLKLDFGEQQIAREIVVYIDPAPTCAGTSLQAMVFTCRVKRPQTGVHYVILAVEEFSTEEIDSEGKDDSRALAAVFIGTISTLTRLYDNYFTTFYVAPEANAMQLDRFWVESARNVTAELSGVTILGTTIVADKWKEPKKRRRKRSDYEEMLLPATTRKKYRVGYTLGARKVSHFYGFFTTLYNPPSSSLGAVVCAQTLWSFFLSAKTNSVPAYIAQKLESLQLIPRAGGAFKISGKGGKNPDGSFQTDDLAVAVVMSVILAREIFEGTYRGEFIQLEDEAVYEMDVDD